jgi:hypothetical protein
MCRARLSRLLIDVCRRLPVDDRCSSAFVDERRSRTRSVKDSLALIVRRESCARHAARTLRPELLHRRRPPRAHPHRICRYLMARPCRCMASINLLLTSTVLHIHGHSRTATTHVCDCYRHGRTFAAAFDLCSVFERASGHADRHVSARRSCPPHQGQNRHLVGRRRAGHEQSTRWRSWKIGGHLQAIYTGAGSIYKSRPGAFILPSSIDEAAQQAQEFFLVERGGGGAAEGSHGPRRAAAARRRGGASRCRGRQRR